MWLGKFSLFINDVLLIDDIKHNLLSISQLCGNGSNMMFNKYQCIIK